MRVWAHAGRFLGQWTGCPLHISQKLSSMQVLLGYFEMLGHSVYLSLWQEVKQVRKSVTSLTERSRLKYLMLCSWETRNACSCRLFSKLVVSWVILQKLLMWLTEAFWNINKLCKPGGCLGFFICNLIYVFWAALFPMGRIYCQNQVVEINLLP